MVLLSSGNTQSNYVLGNTKINNLPRLSSPTLPVKVQPQQQPQLPPASSLSPVTRVITPHHNNHNQFLLLHHQIPNTNTINTNNNLHQFNSNNNNNNNKPPSCNTNCHANGTKSTITPCPITIRHSTVLSTTSILSKPSWCATSTTICNTSRSYNSSASTSRPFTTSWR